MLCRKRYIVRPKVDILFCKLTPRPSAYSQVSMPVCFYFLSCPVPEWPRLLVFGLMAQVMYMPHKQLYVLDVLFLFLYDFGPDSPGSAGRGVMEPSARQVNQRILPYPFVVGWTVRQTERHQGQR